MRTDRITTTKFLDGLAKYVASWKRFIWSLPIDFKPALHAFLLIIVPSTLLLPMPYLAPSIFERLKSSWSTPWGVFTSIWVHYDLTHYAGNMLFLLLFVILFAIVNEYYPLEEKLRRSTVLIWNPIVSGVAANLYTLAMFPLTSAAGASGALFGFEGVCLGYAFLNSYPPSFKLNDLREHFFGPQHRDKSLRGLVVFGSLVLWFAVDRSGFLFVAPGVNWFAHLVGLFVGFSLTGVYEFAHGIRKAGAPNNLLHTWLTTAGIRKAAPEWIRN